MKEPQKILREALPEFIGGLAAGAVLRNVSSTLGQL